MVIEIYCLNQQFIERSTNQNSKFVFGQSFQLESGFLSAERSQGLIPQFMEKVLHLLNKYGRCSIPAGEP